MATSCHKRHKWRYTVGYDVYDLYDFREFDQKGNVRTKCRTKEELINITEAVHDAGLKVHADG